MSTPCEICKKDIPLGKIQVIVNGKKNDLIRMKVCSKNACLDEAKKMLLQKAEVRRKNYETHK